MKPGSCGPMALGIYAVIYDEERQGGPGRQGGQHLHPQPVAGDHARRSGASPERFVSIYYEKYNKDPDSKDWHDWPYFAGDGAVRRPGRLLPDPRAGWTT